MVRATETKNLLGSAMVWHHQPAGFITFFSLSLSLSDCCISLSLFSFCFSLFYFDCSACFFFCLYCMSLCFSFYVCLSLSFFVCLSLSLALTYLPSFLLFWLSVFLLVIFDCLLYMSLSLLFGCLPISVPIYLQFLLPLFCCLPSFSLSGYLTVSLSGNLTVSLSGNLTVSLSGNLNVSPVLSPYFYLSVCLSLDLCLTVQVHVVSTLSLLLVLSLLSHCLFVLLCQRCLSSFVSPFYLPLSPPLCAFSSC